MGPGL